MKSKLGRQTTTKIIFYPIAKEEKTWCVFFCLCVFWGRRAGCQGIELYGVTCVGGTGTPKRQTSISKIMMIGHPSLTPIRPLSC